MKTRQELEALLAERPQLRIRLSNFKEPAEICALARGLGGFRHYLYRITRGSLLIKYGMSYGSHGQPLERLYRQIGHCKSWGTGQLKGACGADWLVIEQLLDECLGIKPVDHRDLEVTVWDFTNYEFTLLDQRLELWKLEQGMISAYRSLVGERPIGNLQDDEWLQHKTSVSRAQFDKMFVYDGSYLVDNNDAFELQKQLDKMFVYKDNNRIKNIKEFFELQKK